MKYPIALIFSLFVISRSVAQTLDYDSVYLLNNCVVLDAKESIQEEREDLIYQWTFEKGEVAYGQIVEYCYDSLGTYEAVLSVIDPQVNALFQEEWFFQVTITENYNLSFGIKKQGGYFISAFPKLSFQNAPEQVDFFWDYGDGNFDVGKNVEHEFPKAGSYLVRLLARVEYQGEVINLVQTKTIVIEGYEGI
ncbi:MAG: PKD domain-containing protein [Reichenbachiella sp.]|uniref:PKD domain-containing protein n=1 Tax=Reichenbachiella sp. TaxID=2184521 RepID=UPI0032974A11